MNTFNGKSLIAIGLLCAACTGDRGMMQSPGSGVAIYHAPTDAKALRIFQSASVSCGNENECPESVGIVIFVSGRDVNRCTMSLVGHDIIMANSHCVPNSLKTGSFNGKMDALFPRVKDKGAERIPFSQLVRAIPSTPMEDEGYLGADVAFIKLSAIPNRIPLVIDHSGIANGETLDLYRGSVDKNGAFDARIDHQRCTAVQDTWFDFEFDKSQSWTFTSAGCALDPGNSGSPLVSSAGKVKGVASMGFFPEKMTLEAFKHLYRIRPSEKLEDEIRNMAAGTNLSCVDTRFVDGQPQAPNCAPNPPVTEKDFYADFEKKIESSINESANRSIADWLRTDGRAFQWDVLKSDLDVFTKDGTITSKIRVVPTCVVPRASINRGGKLQPSSQVWLLKRRTNSFLQPSFEFEMTDGPLVTIDLPECTSNSPTDIIFSNEN